MQILSASDDESAATATTTGAPDVAAAKAGDGGAQGRNAVKDVNQRQLRRSGSSSSSRLSRKNEESDHSESDTHQLQRHGSSLSVDDGSAVGGSDEYWLMTTNILRDIIDGCLASATADVKSNLIKAMNNLMVSDERRAALVEGNEMSSLFELVHGYTPEVG